ncbi:unnamed protein product, partial [Rotaria sordida]
PVATIVVGGGKNTIENIYYDLKFKIAVLLISGTGYAADFLSRWLLYTKELDNELTKQHIVSDIDEFFIISNEGKCSSLRPLIPKSQNRSKSIASSIKRTSKHLDSKNKKLSEIFKNYIDRLEKDITYTFFRDNDSNKVKGQDKHQQDDDKQNSINKLLNQVMFCLQPAVRTHLTIFNSNLDMHLSEKIFQTICHSRKNLAKIRENERLQKFDTQKDNNEALKNVYHQNEIERKIEKTKLLRLAMKWENIQVAKDFIFQNSLDNIMRKNALFKEALKQNLPIFVYEFLRLKIKPADIFFQKDLDSQNKSKYANFIRELYHDQDYDKTHLKNFLEKDDNNKIIKIDSVVTLNNILEKLIGDYMHQLYFETEADEKKYHEEKRLGRLFLKSETDPHQYIMRDLFLWAILMNYIDMAKVFLSFMEYRICSALIATKILKEYYSVASYGDLKTEYEKASKYFENYAIDCLDKCDDENVNQTCEIILQRNELYGYVTCLQVAADADDKKFLATQCCVQAMDDIWFDKLPPDQNTYKDQLRNFVGVISLGLLAPVTILYRENKTARLKHTPILPKFSNHGINYSDPSLLEDPQSSLLESDDSFVLYWNRFKNFHLSLRTKYIYHLITYIFFLLLFSYVLLFNFSPPIAQTPSIHWTEIFTIILVSCILIEEIHYFCTQDNLGFLGKTITYFTNYFKLMTLLAIILFYIGLIVRFTRVNSEDSFRAARIIMAIDIEIWWLRSISFVVVIPYLGPHLVA